MDEQSTCPWGFPRAQDAMMMFAASVAPEQNTSLDESKPSRSAISPLASSIRARTLADVRVGLDGFVHAVSCASFHASRAA